VGLLGGLVRGLSLQPVEVEGHGGEPGGVGELALRRQLFLRGDPDDPDVRQDLLDFLGRFLGQRRHLPVHGQPGFQDELLRLAPRPDLSASARTRRAFSSSCRAARRISRMSPSSRRSGRPGAPRGRSPGCFIVGMVSPLPVRGEGRPPFSLFFAWYIFYGSRIE